MPPRRSTSVETSPPAGGQSQPPAPPAPPASGTDAPATPPAADDQPTPPPDGGPADFLPAPASSDTPPASDQASTPPPTLPPPPAPPAFPAPLDREALFERTRVILMELPEPVPVLAPAIVDAIAAVPDEHRAAYAELIRATAAVNRGIAAAAEGLRALWALCRTESGRELLVARGIDAQAVGTRLREILTPVQS